MSILQDSIFLFIFDFEIFLYFGESKYDGCTSINIKNTQITIDAS